MLYRLLWDIMKDTAEARVETGKMLKVNDGYNTVRWSELLDMMDQAEKACGVKEKWYYGTAWIDTPMTIVVLLGLCFACLGVAAAVLYVMGGIAFVD